MKDRLFTQKALQGSRLAAAFRREFETTKVGECSVEISEPEESTRGGALALQHVALKSPAGHSLVVATVNALGRQAELRTFGFVAGMHEARFDLPVPFDIAAYTAFLEQATKVLADQGIATSIHGESTIGGSPSLAPTSGSNGATRAVIVALILGVLGGVALMWLLRG